MAEAPKSREALKDPFEGVAKGFKLVVDKIKKWWESSSKPEERDFAPVAEVRDSLREEVRDQNGRDEKPGRVFVASRESYGEAADMVGNPEVSLKVGDPMLLQGRDGEVVDRLVTAEDVEKQRLIDRNRERMGEDNVDLRKMAGDGYGDELQKRVIAFSDALTAREDFKKLSLEDQQKMYDRIQGTLGRRGATVKDNLSSEKIDQTMLDEMMISDLSKEGEMIPADINDAERAKLIERWDKIVEKEALQRVSKIDVSTEKKLQDMVREDLTKDGVAPEDSEVKSVLNTKRVEKLILLLKEQKLKETQETIFCRNQGEIAALDKLIDEIKNASGSFDGRGELEGVVGIKIQNAQVDALMVGKEVRAAREARKNGFDRVSMKPAEQEVFIPPVTPTSWTPGGYPGEKHTVSPLPPEGTSTPSWTPGEYPGQRYDVKPLPPEGPGPGPDGPGPDGPIGPTGPDTPPVTPPGPERVVSVQDLKNEYDRLRDLYIMDRRATRGAGLEKGILDRDRADMERAKEAYIGAQMRAAMESVRSATAGIEAGEAARAQTEALTAIGLDLNTRLDGQFLQSEREREPNGWYAKFNRFWMSKAGSAVKVVGGVGLTTVGGFTGLLPLVGLGTTMAASGIGWEAGKAWGRNKLQTPEQISRMSAEQIDQTLNSQRELMRRQGRVDPERVATIQALEARRDQILTERMTERVQRMILEEGGLSSENITRATTDALNLENGSFLRTGEATDERARKWEIRRRKIAGIAGGIGVGLASLAAQFGQAAGNLASEAATRTAMRADYDGNGVWNWVRNNGKEFWDTATKTWKATGGVGGFSGAKEILVTLPK